jgi:hypothetical protein
MKSEALRRRVPAIHAKIGRRSEPQLNADL